MLFIFENKNAFLSIILSFESFGISMYLRLSQEKACSPINVTDDGILMLSTVEKKMHLYQLFEVLNRLKFQYI